MDANTLQNEISRLTADAKSRHDEANKLRTSATGYRATGNDSMADVDESQAEKLDQDANGLDQQARLAESNLAATIVRIRDIDRKQADLKARYEQEMSALQKEKDNLEGGVGSYSSSLF